jgi:hypothetical protein
VTFTIWCTRSDRELLNERIRAFFTLAIHEVMVSLFVQFFVSILLNGIIGLNINKNGEIRTRDDCLEEIAFISGVCNFFYVCVWLYNYFSAVCLFYLKASY